jgi:hypothetical protein
MVFAIGPCLPGPFAAGPANHRAHMMDPRACTERTWAEPIFMLLVLAPARRRVAIVQYRWLADSKNASSLQTKAAPKRTCASRQDPT